MKYVLILISLSTCFLAKAGDSLRFRPLTVSLFSNATAMPGATVLEFGAIHPGATVGTEFFIRHGKCLQWYESAKLGYFYHQYAQHAFQLYTENGIRHHFSCGLNTGIAAGVGLLVSRADMAVYALSSDGVYQESSRLRVQCMPSVAITLGWDFMLKNGLPLRVFASYQAWFQLPYVKQYVPILPNVSTHVGVSIPFALGAKNK